jgi:hypothetical protein
MVEWYWQRNTPNSSTGFLWQFYQHLLASRRNGRRTWKIWHWDVFLFILPRWFLTCRNNLRHGASGFTSPPKEGVLRTFIALKNPSSLPGLNPRTLGPVASALTIAPPRRLSVQHHTAPRRPGVVRWKLTNVRRNAAVVVRVISKVQGHFFWKWSAVLMLIIFMRPSFCEWDFRSSLRLSWRWLSSEI